MSKTEPEGGGAPAPPAPGVLAALRGAGTATVSTQLLKRGLRAHYLRGVRPLGAAAPFAAPAYTLRYVPAREDKAVPEVWTDRAYPQRAAIEAAPAGWALVVDAMGDAGAGPSATSRPAPPQTRCRGAGDRRRGARRRGAGGDGLPRLLRRAAAPASIAALFAADRQCPIAWRRRAIFPGDVLVGDADGAVVVPRALAEEVARDGAEQDRLERFIQSRIAAGHPTFGAYPPDDATLAAYAEWTEG